MDIARRLRRDNIAEYILYLWQLEDLFRSLQFSPEAIYTKFVAPRSDLAPAEQQALHSWYVEYCELLDKEGKRAAGHSEHTLHLISDLEDMHRRLLTLPVGARYRTLFTALEEVLPDLRSVAGESASQMGDIELCFRALYGAVLYRLKGQSGRGAVEDTLAYISPAIAELVKVYGQSERGEIDLFREG